MSVETAPSVLAGPRDTSHDPRPVFVDPSGRRVGWVRRGNRAVIAAAVGFVALLAVSLFDLPGVPRIDVPGIDLPRIGLPRHAAQDALHPSTESAPVRTPAEVLRATVSSPGPAATPVPAAHAAPSAWATTRAPAATVRVAPVVSRPAAPPAASSTAPPTAPPTAPWTRPTAAAARATTHPTARPTVRPSASPSPRAAAPPLAVPSPTASRPAPR